MEERKESERNREEIKKVKKGIRQSEREYMRKTWKEEKREGEMQSERKK